MQHPATGRHPILDRPWVIEAGFYGTQGWRDCAVPEVLGEFEGRCFPERLSALAAATLLQALHDGDGVVDGLIFRPAQAHASDCHA